jgi:predicted phosphodiesterase
MGGVAVSDLIKDLKMADQKSKLGRLADLLDKNNINVDDIGDIKRVSIYQSLTKNEEGEAEIHDLTAIQFSPKWASGPEWPVITQGPSYKVPPINAGTKANGSDYQTAVILPDIQIGYYRSQDDSLSTTHDETALSVALAITKSVKPDKVILLGDNLDFPEFGKYRLSPAYQRTTQATIDRATTLCAELRTVAPNAEIIWLAGNHEERLPRMLIDNAVSAFGLRKGNTPESWPVMSVPYLCRMDEYGVTFKPGYPASHYWVNERLKIIHGDRVKSNGSTSHMYLNSEKVSVIYGHVHRREWNEKTREDWDGPKTIMAASPGCLAKTTGDVPSTKGGLDLDGRPLTVVENWQQGLAVVTYQPQGEARFHYEQVPIHDGEAFYRGKIFYGKEKEA